MLNKPPCSATRRSERFHGATLRATRDTQLLRLPALLLEMITAAAPRVGLSLLTAQVRVCLLGAGGRVRLYTVTL